MKKKILLLLASSLFLAGCSQGDAPSSSVNESSSEIPPVSSVEGSISEASSFEASSIASSVVGSSSEEGTDETSSASESSSEDLSSSEEGSVSESDSSSEEGSVSESDSASEEDSASSSSSEPSAAGWAGLEGSETYTKLSDFLSENGITDISDFPYMDVSQGTEWSYDYNSTHTMFGLVALTGGNRNNNAILINAYKEKLSGVGYTNPTEDELDSFINDNYDVFYNPKIPENIFVMGNTGLVLELLDIGSTEFDGWSTFAPVLPDGTASNQFTEGIMISILVLVF